MNWKGKQEMENKKPARFRGSMAVLTRRGSKIHLWAGLTGKAKTICGLEYVDVAPDVSPSNANCAKCKEN